MSHSNTSFSTGIRQIKRTSTTAILAKEWLGEKRISKIRTGSLFVMKELCYVAFRKILS